MNIGAGKPRRFPDRIAVRGNPVQEISTLRKVRFVMKVRIFYEP